MTPGSDCIREIRRTAGSVVVVLAGEFNMHEVPAVQIALNELCKGRPARLVVDLGNVTCMDSSGLGVLVATLRRVREYHGQMALCALPARIRGLFEITHLDKAFSIYPSEAEALQG
jgi:anti-sigma B factor antagonist